MNQLLSLILVFGFVQSKKTFNLPQYLNMSGVGCDYIEHFDLMLDDVTTQVKGFYNSDIGYYQLDGLKYYQQDTLKKLKACDVDKKTWQYSLNFVRLYRVTQNQIYLDQQATMGDTHAEELELQIFFEQYNSDLQVTQDFESRKQAMISIFFTTGFNNYSSYLPDGTVILMPFTLINWQTVGEQNIETNPNRQFSSAYLIKIFNNYLLMQSDNLKCSIHQQRSIIGFCISKQCKSTRPSCLLCLRDQHKAHPQEILEFDEVKNLIENKNKSWESVLYQINELESVIQIIKISFQSLMKIPDLDSTKSIHDQLETALKIDETQQQTFSTAFQDVMKQIGKYVENIFSFNMEEFTIKENIEKLNQVQQLVAKEGYNKSFKVLENIILSQTQQLQQIKVQSLFVTLYQSLGFIQKKQQLNERGFIFSINEAHSSIQITQNNKKAEKKQIQNYYNSIALIEPSLGKSGCIKIKFRISQLYVGIGLGICIKQRAIQHNIQPPVLSNIGHGFYMVYGHSQNQYLFSNIDPYFNNKLISTFPLQNNDCILMTVDFAQANITWDNYTRNQKCSMKFQVVDDLSIFTELFGDGDSVEIID